MAPAVLVLLAAIPWGQVPVTTVHVVAPGAKDPARLTRIFGVKPGEVLHRQAIRQGVQALLASQEVEDVRVELAPEGDGVTLVFRAQVASRVSRLEFSGLPRRQKELVSRQLGVKVGTPLHMAHFEQALARAAEVLKADGFPSAELQPELNFDVARGTVDVRILGRLGPPMTLCQIEATGFPWDQAKLWRACDVKPGNRLTAGTREGMRRKLLASLRKAGFWQAEVEGPFLQSESCGISARFAITPGDHFTLAVKGDPVPQEALAEALPFLSGEDGFAEGSEEWLANRLRLFLQRRGYLLAQVGVSQETTPSGRRLVVAVKRGSKLPILGVRFPGISEQSSLAATLRGYVTAAAGRLATLAGHTVDDDHLTGDRDALQQALQALGYAQVQVGVPRLIREGKGVVVEFPVELGPRLVVGSLELRGWPEGLDVPALPLASGEAWSQGAEEEARVLLADHLASAGFPEAAVKTWHQCRESTCEVVIEVQPGPRVYISRVVVAALGRTDPAVVEKMVGVTSGEPFSPETVLQAQRRLLSLGIFEKVTVKEIPGQDFGGERGLVVEPVEAPSRSVTVGIGWDTEDKLRLSGTWSELNLWGKARTLSVEGRFSARTRRFQVNYREPALLGLFGQPTWVAIYRTEETFPTYSLLRRGMWVEVGDHLVRPKRFLLRYDYQIIAPDAPEDILSGLERAKQQLRLASLTPIFEWDTRDDVLSPTRGTLFTLQLQRAFPVFLADAAFTKVTAGVSWLKPAWDTVLAFGLRTGAVKPYQGSAATPDNLRVPIAARFFAGGRISHRAFATDRLGIPGQTLLCPRSKTSCTVSELEPVGGAAQLLANVEWRVPISGSLGVALFLDSGNTWASLSQMAVDDLRWGAGLGLRFETPVGPLRLEYGWKLDRLPGESKGELFLSFGNPF